jgi:hypothetical protein
MNGDDLLVACPSPRLIRFGVFELDLRSGELQKQGRKIRLEGQPVQILICLLENPGELVTREELHRKLWPADTFVNFEHGLNAAVKRLRQALNDSADNPRFVETLPRRGLPVHRSGPGLFKPRPRSAGSPFLEVSRDGRPRSRRRVLPRAWMMGLVAALLVAALGLALPIWASPPAASHSVSGRASAGKPIGRCVAGLFLRRHDRRTDRRTGADRRIAGDFSYFGDDLQRLRTSPCRKSRGI